MAEHSRGCPVLPFTLDAQAVPPLTVLRRLDEVRQQHPVFFTEDGGTGYFVFTRHKASLDGLQRTDLFSSRSVVATDPDPQYMWIPEMLDPPAHGTWRRLLGPLFSPGSVDRLEPRVRERCVELVNGIAGRDSCDFSVDFARQFPTSIFLEIFGLPREDFDLFMGWIDAIMHTPPEEDPGRAKGMATMGAVQQYFLDLLRERRGTPREDILSTALTWQIDGQPVSDEQLLSFCLLMFMAGLDTVTAELTYAFFHLATHDDDRKRVVAEPAVIAPAVEEFLRAYPIVSSARKVVRDVEFHGVQLHAGDMVLFPTTSANRDESVVDKALQVELDRPRNRHIAFGGGPHRCLGSHLARLELTIALEEWHRRIPDYRVDPDHEVVEHGGGVLGIDRLRLLLG